jgi:hypothetical protein
MGNSDGIEDRLGRATYEAGRALVTDGQYDWALAQGIEFLVPVLRHIANVQVIGIARLRYRPHTRITAAWWADLNANAEKHLARYGQLFQQNTRLPPNPVPHPDLKEMMNDAELINEIMGLMGNAYMEDLIGVVRRRYPGISEERAHDAVIRVSIDGGKRSGNRKSA